MTNNINSKTTLAFVIVLFVSVIAGIIWYLLSASQYKTYQIQTQDSVSGLIVDAPIEFHGVDVGKVKDIELTNAHSVSILVTIKKAAPITMATVATITARGLATRGFTGYVYVSLEDTGTDSRELIVQSGKRYPVIPAAPSKLVSLDTTLKQMNENVQLATQLLQSVLDKETIISLRQAIDSLQKVTKTLAQMNENVQLGTQLLQSVLDKETIISLKQAVDSLQKVTKTLAENNKKLNSIIINTEQASDQFKPLLESSNSTVKALQTQILPEVHQAVSNLDNVSSSLTSVVKKIDRDPSILIRGAAPPPLGPGETK